jgi:hypothetical protein
MKTHKLTRAQIRMLRAASEGQIGFATYGQKKATLDVLLREKFLKERKAYSTGVSLCCLLTAKGKKAVKA